MRLLNPVGFLAGVGWGVYPGVYPPEQGRPPMEVIEQAARDILPFALRLDHPRCFGFIPSAPTWPGVLADFLAAGYNINACTWLVASGASQVELVVIDWFRRWLGFPESAGGLLTSGGSAASGRRLRGGARRGRPSGTRHRLHERPERSLRALKVWMSIQTFGMAAFRRAVAKGMELASRAEQYVLASPVLEFLTPVSLGIVCFRVNPADRGLDEADVEQINRTVLARIFWEDRAFLSSTLLHGRFALRLCIINHNTAWDDVRETLEVAERFGREAASTAAAGSVKKT